MLILYRLSHVGKVCSGDYAEDQYWSGKVVTTDDQFDKYYLKAEGQFLWGYLIIGIIGSLMFAGFSCVLGSCLFMGGSFMSLKLIEDLVKNFDNIPEMMKQKANEKGFGKKDEEAKKPEEEFKEEFKRE